MPPKIPPPKIAIVSDADALESSIPYLLWSGDTQKLLGKVSKTPIFDLVVTSPPYNLEKEYERDHAYSPKNLDKYLEWQKKIILDIVPLVKDTGSICWQVGNFIQNGSVVPLDIELAPIFKAAGLQLRNRIVWKFGHGLHCKRRFSGRYEVILWFTKTNKYTFNLDSVRVPSKYPGKKHFKGPRIGQYSSNPLGKNPEDVWDIPNVKGNHIEKTRHPCQFPVGLIERLILSLTSPNDLVFDPFAGVGSAGVAATLHGRRFWGGELSAKYIPIAQRRINAALAGKAKYRPHNKPIYDHLKSNLSMNPHTKKRTGAK